MHSICWQIVDCPTPLIFSFFFFSFLPSSTVRLLTTYMSIYWVCQKSCWSKCWLVLTKRNLLGAKEIMLTKCWLRLICKSTHLIHLSNRPTHLQNLSFANFDELGPRWCAVMLINIRKQPHKKRFDIKGILEGGQRQKKWIRWRSDRPSIKQPNGGTERCQLCALLDTTLGRDKKMRDSKSALIIHKITIWLLF